MTLLELSKQKAPVSLNEMPTMPRHLTIPPQEAPDKFTAVHEMFHQHAISNPNRIAMSCAESNHAMSYGELDESSSLKAQGT